MYIFGYLKTPDIILSLVSSRKFDWTHTFDTHCNIFRRRGRLRDGFEVIFAVVFLQVSLRYICETKGTKFGYIQSCYVEFFFSLFFAPLFIWHFSFIISQYHSYFFITFNVKNYIVLYLKNIEKQSLFTQKNVNLKRSVFPLYI